MLDPQESPEEIKNREVKLGSLSWTSFACFSTAVLRSPPLSPQSQSLISHLASVDVKQNVYYLSAAGES